MQLFWRIRLLGDFCVQRGEEAPAHFETRQTAALLTYLAFFPDRAHSREALAEQLWPEEDPETTRSRLRTTLWALRRILEPEPTLTGSVLISDRAEIRLDANAFTTDTHEFECALKAAAQTIPESERAACLRRAITLYTDDLLPGRYEDWVSAERERLAAAYRQALGQAAEVFARLGDLPAAISYAKRAISADSLDEEAHAALIRLYGQAGRSVDAIRQYQELERILRAEMGLRPAAATRALLTQLQRPAAPAGSGASDVKANASEPPEARLDMEPEGGGVPLESSFYIERESDALFSNAIARQDSIVLVKGARQMGKTSLLARGLQKARAAGTRVVLMDLQKLTTEQMATSDSLFLTLARDIADQLELDVSVDELWQPVWGWNVNFERFLRRQVLADENGPLVWGLDEVDRLFGHPYSADVFGLFRSWHNARSLNPSGPWSRLTLTMAYATEAHLFITDLNQSPFNVGTRLILEDFLPGEVAELNRRYNSPLQNEAELARYVALVGGHPYLVRRGLHTMVTRGLDITALEIQALQEDGLFSDHLRRMRLSLQQDAGLRDAVRDVLRGQPCPSGEAFFRLQSAGIFAGHSLAEARMRCKLYQMYLETHLP